MEATGTRLGRYRLVRRIGEGGMGVVHLALDEAGHAVAIKVLRPAVAGDPHARRRLAREVQTLQRVVHTRVAPVLDADVDGDTPYVVTRYVPAPSLDAYVREHGALDRDALARLGEGLGEALAAIHEAGVVHRDLKPGNVLMLDGDPVVIDFGIAHVADDVRLTSTGLVMGTPGFLAPEVLVGEPVSTATDWWGWAATMTYAATGRPPFGRGPVEVVLDRVRRAEFDLYGVDAGLVPVLARALAVEPSERPTPGELRVALAEFRAAGAVEDDGAAPGPATQVLPAVPRDAPGSQEGRRPDAQRPEAPPTRALPAVPPHERPSTTAEQPVQRRPPPVAPSSPSPAVPAAPPARGGSTQGVDVPRAPRTGTLLAGLVTLAAVAAVAPVVALVLGLAGSVVARTVDRTAMALLRRRYERGPRRGDTGWAVAGSPVHLLGAALASVPAAVLPLLAGVGTAYLVRFLTASGGTSPAAGALPLALGAVAATLTAWWGPGGASLRRGSRLVARSLTPGLRGGQVAVALLAIVSIAALIVVLGGAQPDWTPLQGPPFGAW